MLHIRIAGPGLRLLLLVAAVSCASKSAAHDATLSDGDVKTPGADVKVNPASHPMPLHSHRKFLPARQGLQKKAANGATSVVESARPKRETSAELSSAAVKLAVLYPQAGTPSDRRHTGAHVSPVAKPKKSLDMLHSVLMKRSVKEMTAAKSTVKPMREKRQVPLITPSDRIIRKSKKIVVNSNSTAGKIRKNDVDPPRHRRQASGKFLPADKKVWSVVKNPNFHKWNNGPGVHGIRPKLNLPRVDLVNKAASVKGESRHRRSAGNNMSVVKKPVKTSGNYLVVKKPAADKVGSRHRRSPRKLTVIKPEDAQPVKTVGFVRPHKGVLRRQRAVIISPCGRIIRTKTTPAKEKSRRKRSPIKLC